MYGVDKLVPVFVGQLAKKGMSVKCISDLASRLDPITWLKAEQKHSDWLTFSNFFDTEHLRIISYK